MQQQYSKPWEGGGAKEGQQVTAAEGCGISWQARKTICQRLTGEQGASWVMYRPHYVAFSSVTLSNSSTGQRRRLNEPLVNRLDALVSSA